MSAADRVVDHLGPSLALRPRKRFRKDTVLIVDGTLVPTRDRTVAASGKNHRCSTHHQVVIDADALPRTPSGDPTVTAAGGYRGTALVIPPHRRNPASAAHLLQAGGTTQEFLHREDALEHRRKPQGDLKEKIRNVSTR